MGKTLKYIWKPAREGAFQHGRGSASVRSLIMHSTDGRCSGDVQTLTGHDPHLVSVHWYVTRTGDLYHFVDTQDTAWHAGVVKDPKYNNQHSIGIEHEHFDGSEDWPDAQIATSAALVTWIRQQFPNIEIVHHADVASPPGRKVDPVNFPSNRFWAEVGKLNGEEVGMEKAAKTS